MADWKYPWLPSPDEVRICKHRRYHTGCQQNENFHRTQVCVLLLQKSLELCHMLWVTLSLSLSLGRPFFPTGPWFEELAQFPRIRNFLSRPYFHPVWTGYQRSILKRGLQSLFLNCFRYLSNKSWQRTAPLSLSCALGLQISWVASTIKSLTNWMSPLDLSSPVRGPAMWWRRTSNDDSRIWNTHKGQELKTLYGITFDDQLATDGEWRNGVNLMGWMRWINGWKNFNGKIAGLLNEWKNERKRWTNGWMNWDETGWIDIITSEHNSNLHQNGSSAGIQATRGYSWKY